MDEKIYKCEKWQFRGGEFEMQIGESAFSTGRLVQVEDQYSFSSLLRKA